MFCSKLAAIATKSRNLEFPCRQPEPIGTQISKCLLDWMGKGFFNDFCPPLSVWPCLGPRSLFHQYSPPKNSFPARNISLQKPYFHQRKNASPKNICLPIFPLRFKECSLQGIKVVGVKGVVMRFLVFCPQGFSKKKGLDSWLLGS